MWRWALVAVLATLAGCQMLGVRPSPPVPPLLEPGSGGLNVQLNQRMTLSMDGRKHHMVMVVSFSPTQTRMTGFTLTGQRLLDIVQEGGRITSWQSELVDRDIPARWLLSQMQLAYWPERALRRAYHGPWSLRQKARERALYLEDELVVMVSYAADFSGPEAGSRLTINHHRMALVMAIETLKVKELAARSGPDNMSEAGQ
ncbi:DUF3261 domain-containing protein [Marinobacter nauticus]